MGSGCRCLGRLAPKPAPDLLVLCYAAFELRKAIGVESGHADAIACILTTQNAEYQITETTCQQCVERQKGLFWRCGTFDIAQRMHDKCCFAQFVTVCLMSTGSDIELP